MHGSRNSSLLMEARINCSLRAIGSVRKPLGAMSKGTIALPLRTIFKRSPNGTISLRRDSPGGNRPAYAAVWIDRGLRNIDDGDPRLDRVIKDLRDLLEQ